MNMDRGVLHIVQRSLFLSVRACGMLVNIKDVIC